MPTRGIRRDKLEEAVRSRYGLKTDNLDYIDDLTDSPKSFLLGRVDKQKAPYH